MDFIFKCHDRTLLNIQKFYLGFKWILLSDKIPSYTVWCIYIWHKNHMNIEVVCAIGLRMVWYRFLTYCAGHLKINNNLQRWVSKDIKFKIIFLNDIFSVIQRSIMQIFIFFKCIEKITLNFSWKCCWNVINMLATDQNDIKSWQHSILLQHQFLIFLACRAYQTMIKRQEFGIFHSYFIFEFTGTRGVHCTKKMKSWLEVNFLPYYTALFNIFDMSWHVTC